MRAYLKGTEHGTLSQADFLSQHLPFGENIPTDYWESIDLHSWYSAQTPSAQRALPGLALAYGFTSYFYGHHFILPLLKHSESARAIFDIARSATSDPPFWANHPDYRAILDLPVVPYPIQAHITTAATVVSNSANTQPAHPTTSVPFGSYGPVIALGRGATNPNVGPTTTLQPTSLPPPHPSLPPRPISGPLSLDAGTSTASNLIQASSSGIVNSSLNPAPREQAEPTPSPPGQSSEPLGDPSGSSTTNNHGPVPEVDAASLPPHRVHLHHQPQLWPIFHSGPKDSDSSLPEITTTKDIVVSQPRPVATTLELSEDLLQNFYGQTVALRDRPTNEPYGIPPDFQAELSGLVMRSTGVVAKLTEDRCWFLSTLLAKLQAEIASGSVAMLYSLGPTLIMHKDLYVRRMARTLRSMHPNMGVDAATNEALRIAQGDGLFSQDLVTWGQLSGKVELNLKPLMPECYQKEYKGPSRVKIGCVDPIKPDEGHSDLDNVMPFLYGPGASEQQSLEHAHTFAHGRYGATTLLRTTSGAVVDRSTQGSKRMRGEIFSAFSTGRFFGDGKIPPLPHSNDTQFETIAESVKQWDETLRKEVFDQAKHFVEHSMRSLLPETQLSLGSSSQSSMDVDPPATSNVFEYLEQGESLPGPSRKRPGETSESQAKHQKSR
ncbi:hypothetical protein FRC07_009520 [Ceratobasidium sp. 392]|nr:hypothetical protein FRC07_009520 [Ceratobasidium sp. 392]